MAVLQLTTGEGVGQQHELNRERSVMGRHPGCEIVLDAAAVSRQHAQIIADQGAFFVEDLHSRNGTFVNGQLISGRHALLDGDRLKICDLQFTFFERAPEPTADPSEFMLDDDAPVSSSTIMSKLEAPGLRGVRLAVNPEIKLRAMIEIMQSLSKAMAVEDVLPKILDSLFKIFPQADRGFVIMRAKADGPLVPKAIKFRRSDLEDRGRISRTIVNEALNSKEAILSIDASNDARFETSQSIADLRIRSVMCAPLIDSDDKALGVIQVDTQDQRQRFSQDDLDVLASVASQAAVAIDNATMHEVALKTQSVERDLELAHKVQRGLLPASPPVVPGYFFFDFYEAANQVGGDYYDYIELPNGRVAVVIADVSGKGVSAALLMARLSSEVRYCLASEPTPAEALSRINASFCRSGWDDRFVTFVMAVISLSDHTLTVANAGHMPPLLRRGTGVVEEIGADESGVPLGIDCDYRYLQSVRHMAPGDFLTMCTDGISEAMNEANELYGLRRLEEHLRQENVEVVSLGKTILEDVQRFVGTRVQSDDICLVCVGRA